MWKLCALIFWMHTINLAAPQDRVKSLYLKLDVDPSRLQNQEILFHEQWVIYCVNAQSSRPVHGRCMGLETWMWLGSVRLFVWHWTLFDEWRKTLTFYGKINMAASNGVVNVMFTWQSAWIYSQLQLYKREIYGISNVGLCRSELRSR